MRLISLLIISSHGFFRAILFLYKRGDGVFNIFNKAFSIIKTEGWFGIKYRIGFISHNDYSEWLSQYDIFTEKTKSDMRVKSEQFAQQPIISILMPVYNAKPEWLMAAIDSVRGQIYPHWQLCIADDASTDPAILPILQQYIELDSRIHVVFREQNGHISSASNSALELVCGEWIALLDQDDLLPSQALFWVVDAINKSPMAALIYSDEDKINEKGIRCWPNFKPDWNRDLFYSQNMICHLGVYRSDLMRKIGGFREGFEGSQDYDLVLRFVEEIDDSQIIHIPRILYHWRAHQQSSAHTNDIKPYALQAGQRALQEHLDRQQIKAKVDLLDFGMYRVKYALPDILPLVTLIIPTRNGFSILKQCLDSIINKTTYSNYEILIIDNGSDDSDVLDYLHELSDRPDIFIIKDDRPFNYSALNNLAENRHVEN
jgi:glycosyltransferase involved in cell wall biosynthesis